MADHLASVIATHGRGGAHRRSREDERLLVDAVCERLGQTSGAGNLRELWLEIGFGPASRAALAGDADVLFALDEGLGTVREAKLAGLGQKEAERRRRAADWWLKTATATPSRRTEALLSGPAVGDALAKTLARERDPRVRESLAGALAMTTLNFFPDANHRDQLAKLVDERHSGIRFFAVQGLAALLGRGASEADVDALAARLKDGSSGVRSVAEQSLRRAADEGRVEAARVEALLQRAAD